MSDRIWFDAPDEYLAAPEEEPDTDPEVASLPQDVSEAVHSEQRPLVRPYCW
jgi:hypothetical protein